MNLNIRTVTTALLIVGISISLMACSGGGGSGSSSSTNNVVTITQGASTSVSMSENSTPTAFSLTLDATDTSSAASLTWSIASAATHGTATASGTGSSMSVAYVPNTGFVGTDSFVVQVSDGKGGTAQTSVNVNVTDTAPTITQASPVAVTMSEGSDPTPFSLTLNGSDVNGDTLSWSIATNASHGTATASGTGNSISVSYTPNKNYTGSDSFVVQVSDGKGGTAQTTVNVTINDAFAVSSVSPANAATGVSRTGTISATLNKNLYTSGYSNWLSVNNGITGTMSESSGSTLTFTPSTTLKMLTQYTATVSSSTSDLAGDTLGASYTWNFTTGDGAWQSNPTAVSTDTTNPSVKPSIGMDDKGDVFMTWYYAPTGASNGYNVIVSQYAASTTSWGTTPQTIDTTVAAITTQPHIAVDGNGDAVVIYQKLNTSSFPQVYASYYSATGKTWSTPQAIITSASVDMYNPQVVIDANGNATAVAWGDDNNIYVARYTATSNTWGSQQSIASSVSGSVNDTFPAIAVDGSGNVVVVWSQKNSTSGYYDLYAAYYTAGTSTWGSATSIRTAATGNALDPQVAFDGNGNAIAVWAEDDGSYFNVWANRLSAGSWVGANMIETQDTNTAASSSGDNEHPYIAFNPSGNATVLWTIQDANNSNYNTVWSNQYTAGTGWGTAKEFETEAGNASYPEIAYDSQGNALAVWQQTDSKNHVAIAANRYQASAGSWSTPSYISDTANTNDASYLADLVINTNSIGEVCWQQNNSSNAVANVWVNRFE